MWKCPSQLAGGRGKFCSRRCANLARPINARPSAIASAAIDHFQAAHPHLVVQREMRVGRFSVDLAIAARKVAVELDGIYWHGLPAMQEKDRRKDAALTAAGWRVVRIPIVRASTPEGLAGQITSALNDPRPGDADAQAEA